MSSEEIGVLVDLFLSVRDQMKIYHWQTESYARHKASDKFVARFTEKMDIFIEVMQGSRGARAILPINEASPYVNHTDESAYTLLESFRVFLKNGIDNYLEQDDVDLYNLRDEMLAIVNQTLYLFTLN